jgi:hypothetical protein
MEDMVLVCKDAGGWMYSDEEKPLFTKAFRIINEVELRKKQARI